MVAIPFRCPVAAPETASTLKTAGVSEDHVAGTDCDLPSSNVAVAAYFTDSPTRRKLVAGAMDSPDTIGTCDGDTGAVEQALEHAPTKAAQSASAEDRM